MDANKKKSYAKPGIRGVHLFKGKHSAKIVFQQKKSAVDMRLYKHSKTRQQTIAKKIPTAAETDMEICVPRGKATGALKTEPLEQRLNHLPGAGQLCKECAIENTQEEKAAMRSGFVYE